MKLIVTIALALVTTAINVPGASAGTPTDSFERADLPNSAAAPTYFDRADAHYSRLQARLEDRDRLDPAIAAAIAARRSTPSVTDLRSPDTIDAALLAKTRMEQVVSGSGFDWGDFAIGASLMLGLMVFVGVLVVGIHAVRSRRAHPSTA